jgi:TPR repeat protein
VSILANLFNGLGGIAVVLCCNITSLRAEDMRQLPTVSTAGRHSAVRSDMHAVEKIETGVIRKQVDYDINFMTPKQAYQRGRLLRAQFKDEEARKYLKYAADKGNGDAAYLYAVELKQYDPTVRTPEEAKHYIEKSARLGNIRAMAYLYQHGNWLRSRVRQLWQKKYYNDLIVLANRNPAQALYRLALYFKQTDPDKSDYLLGRAILYKSPLALMERADRKLGGLENLLTAGVDNYGVLKTYKTAAEDGFIPAMKACIKLYEEQGYYRKALFWRQKAVESGDLTSLVVLAKIYAGEVPSYQFVKKDLVKARAYSELYLDFAGIDRFGSLHQEMEYLFTDTTNEMTSPEIKASGDFIGRYKKEIHFYHHDLYWDS